MTDRAAEQSCKGDPDDTESRAAVTRHGLDWLARYGDDLYAFAIRRVRNAGLAEDLIQDTFLSAIEAIRRGVVVDAPRGFLLTILRRKIIDHHRASVRNADDHEIAPEPVADRVESASHHDPIDQLCADELHEALRRCVESLPVAMRGAFELRVIQGLDVEETAELLGVSSAALSARLYRSRLAIRDCLERRTP